MALNILRDAVFTFTPGGADDGAYSATTPVVTEKLDESQFEYQEDTVDVSTAQDEVPFERIRKSIWGATFRTKLAKAIMRDLTVSFFPGGGDDRIYNEGTELTSMVLDEVRVRLNRTLSDHGTEMNRNPIMRGLKEPFAISNRTKMSMTGKTGLENLIKSNDLIGFAYTLAGSETVTIAGYALSKDFRLGYAGPNSLEFSLSPYGAAPTTLSSSNADGIVAQLLANDLQRAQLLQTPANALDVDVTGIIEFVEMVFGSPCTLEWRLAPYGVTPSFSFPS
jgi:hypothetical protein